MTALRTKIGWPAGDEELNWRTVARARQRLGELSLSRNQFAEATETIPGGGRDRHAARGGRAARPGRADLPGPNPPHARVPRRATRWGTTRLARRHFRRAVEINRGFVAKDPHNDVHKNELANSLGQLAMTEMSLGHLPEAPRVLRRGACGPRLVRSRAGRNALESRRELSGLYEQLAELAFLQGNRDEGRRFYEKCAESAGTGGRRAARLVAGRPRPVPLL